MSYGIVRVQKFKASDVQGIQHHDNRERESRSNPDIKKEQTDKNYSLIACTDFKTAIKDRLNTLESTKAVRKDAVVMVQLLVTSDKDFFDKLMPSEEKEFFKRSLEFISQKYGKDNILSATVHKDEKTPHMHVNLTPIKDHRLTAKSIFDRKGLVTLQNDFYVNLGTSYGLKRGESREEKREHLTTEEFKIQTRREEIEKAALLIKQEKMNFIQASDIKPRPAGKKTLGIRLCVENNQDIADRLNSDYINPIQKKLAQIPVLTEKIKDLEKEQDKQKDREKELNTKMKDFEIYKNFFNGLTREQREAIIEHNNKRQAEQEKAQELQRAKEPVKEKTQDMGRDR